MIERIQFLLLVIILTGVDLGLHTYAIYVCVLVLAIIGKSKFSIKNMPAISGAILFLICWSLLRVDIYDKQMFLDVGLMTLGTLPFILHKKIKFDVLKYNIICGIALIFSQLKGLSNFNLTMENVSQSDIGVESCMLSFIIPLFAIYYYNDKKYTLFIINLILTIIGGKKIAVLGLIMAIIIIELTKRNNTIRMEIVCKSALFVIPFIYIYFTQLLANGFFDDLVYELTGLNINHFTMGRFNLYGFALEKSRETTILGIGTGYTKLLFENSFFLTTRLHNDFLKIYIENGLIGFIGFCFLVSKYSNFKNFPFVVYAIILFMTDNTLVYVSYLIPLFLFIRKKDTIKSKAHNPTDTISI